MMKNKTIICRSLCWMLTLANLIRGLEGFYIKHSSSGFCLKPLDPFVSTGNDGDFYYVGLTNDCLHSTAQFRYRDNGAFFNIFRDGCIIYIKVQGIWVFQVWDGRPDNVGACLNVFRQNSAGSLVFGSKCAVPKEPGGTTRTKNFIEGDHIQLVNYCNRKEQRFLLGTVTSEGRNMTNVSCPPNQIMEIVNAEYYHGDSCSLPAACVMKHHCDGQRLCNINVRNNLFNFDPCPGRGKRLRVEYKCVDNLGSPLTSVNAVRLSVEAFPNEGFIEVLDGTTWKKVDDLMWVKRKQTALCGHLGYDDTRDDDVVRKKITAGENIMSGALHCNGSRPSNESCCAHLYPSTSSSESTIPYAKCKICDEPLLQNSTRFPDQIFSASDANGYEARPSNNGWCSTASGKQHLRIDLQREFYISHIATFGNKAQTKWTKTFQLQYSRTERKLDSSEARKITANQNAYRAAITRLDIVHTRFLKITPDQRDFCIRIQLCGHVLLPNPVENLIVDTDTARTAQISWMLPQVQGLSSITYFVIIVKETGTTVNFTRQGDNNQYTLENLKPYRYYTVSVAAGNAYGVGDNVSKRFRTSQAAPESPPQNVTVVILDSTSLNISWQPPTEDKRNGIIDHYTVYLKISTGRDQPYNDIKNTYFVLDGLKSATEYSLKVSASTTAGVGTHSGYVSRITNQVPVDVNPLTDEKLNISFQTPPAKFGTILVIVQASTTASKSPDEYQAQELYNGGSSGPYVTAVLSSSDVKGTFVVGNGERYSSGISPVVNRPLKEKTDYIIFLRYIENKKVYYSTDWSNSVKTYSKPKAPVNVNAMSLSSSSIRISWEKPAVETNVNLLGYYICYKGENTKEICQFTSDLTYSITGLNPKTTYEIGVRSNTSIGNSEYRNISWTTYEAAVEISRKTYRDFEIKLWKSQPSFTSLQIVVKPASNRTSPPDSYPSNQLKSYNDRGDPSNPYIAAALQSSLVTSPVFIVGNETWYNSTNSGYYNGPLEQKGSYTVFVRFFQTKNMNYSTEWSSEIKLPARPPAPSIEKIVSSGNKGLRISWKESNLPKDQKPKNHIIIYRTLKWRRRKETGSGASSYVLSGLEYDTTYNISVQTVTEAGESEPSQEMLKTTNSEPLSPPRKSNDDLSYTVSLRKPSGRENFERVALIVLQSNATIPQPPEEIQPSNRSDSSSKTFIAAEFNIADFEEDTIDVILEVSDDERRRRRRVPQQNPRKVLQPGMTYRVSQRNYDSSGGYSTSDWSEPFALPGKKKEPVPGGSGSSGGSGLAIGVSIGVIVVLILAVVGLFLWRRNARDRSTPTKRVYEKENDEIDYFHNGANYNNEEEEAQIEDELTEGIYSNETGLLSKEAHAPVPISEFAFYVKEMKANDNYAFKNDYEELPTTSDVSWDVSKKPYNKKKNRYGNIVTYDHSRVVLSGDEYHDYINASHIDGVKPNSYIATQGPTKVTLDDFWRMVWEQRSYSIVMVTSLIELGKSKCEKYWPDEGSIMFGDIQVTLIKTEEFACHVLHTLQIKRDNEEREVKHYYYTSWPDHGVPKFPTQLLAFRRHFRTHHWQESGPMVVHCSAGVGRTGVFLVIDMILEMLEKGLTDSVDVFGQVVAMRKRRMNMIQTLEQYIFAHEAILETIVCGLNEVDSKNVKKEIENLSAVQAGGMTGFQEKFHRLENVSPTFTDEECTAGLLEGNRSKNRFKDIYPVESTRVSLRYVSGVDNSDYINAVFVHGYLGKDYFIATQSPLPNTIDDFWRMVHERNSSTIVLLNGVKEGTSFPKFWPSARAQPKQYGDITVRLETAAEKDGIVTRKFLVSPYPDLHDGRVVKIFQHTKWPNQTVPESPDGVITLMSLVEKARQTSGKGPVTVMCSDGAGRTGTYIAISNLLERMKVEQVVDVFQSIKIIRGSRPQFVENAAQFKFCYEVVSAYLDDFSEYANFE